MTTAAARCPYFIDRTGSNIHAEGAALRALGPAARIVLPGLPDTIAAWSVTDPGLIRRLLAHPGISKDASRHWPALANGQVPADWPDRVWAEVRNALGAYGSEHRRLRRPIAAAFSARRVRALIPKIQNITHALLDDVQDCDPDEVIDLRDVFTARLPLLVVNTVLGVPEQLHQPFRDAVGGLFTTAHTPEEATAVGTRVYELLGQLIKHKEEHPGDDITTALIHSFHSGELSHNELRDSLMLLIGAGHETTVGLLSHAVVNLVSHREQLALATGGEVSWEKVVEETLRHQAPIATILPRFPVREVTDEITGVTFAPGDLIVINYAAAGRDPAQHGASADRFDITRPSHRHLSFGSGVHLCPGAELARIEGRIALAALFERFPDLRLAVEPGQLEPLPSYISNSFTALPVFRGRAAARPDNDTGNSMSATTITPAQKLAVEPLAYGSSTATIAAQISLTQDGVLSHFKSMRRKLGCVGSSRPVLVHALLRARLIAMPSCLRPAPDFTGGELKLLSAIAHYSGNTNIAKAAELPFTGLHAKINGLVGKAGADNSTHLVGLAHRWQLLGTTQPANTAVPKPVTDQ